MGFFYKKAVVLTVAVVTLFLLANSAARGKYNFAVSEQLVTTLMAPVEYVTSRIGYGIQHSSQYIGEIMQVYQLNQQLKAENEKLRREALSDNEVMAENSRLRSMLEYKKAAVQYDLLAAQVVARDPGSWTNEIVINRGSDQGVAKGMPVVISQGLVGNVVQVYGSLSKVMLILDPRSAVGSLVQRTDSRTAAVVEGCGTSPLTPRMVNLSRDADIIKGDRIITSGLGGMYPKGLTVGEVLSVVNEEGGLVKYAIIKPAIDIDRLEEVFVLLKSRDQAASILTPAVVKGAGQ